MKLVLKFQLLITICFISLCSVWCRILPSFHVERKERKNNINFDKKRKKKIKLFHHGSKAKKYTKGLPSSFDNLVAKKLKTYTRHSQFPRWKYKGIKKKNGVKNRKGFKNMKRKIGKEKMCVRKEKIK